MKNRFAILLLLLLAFALRTYRLTDIPPGLTHDEANHGVEAMEVLDGELRFYFPRNYGSEPLYSYLVALTMWGGGENILSLRLVNVWFGVLVIAAAYRLTRDLFRNSLHLAVLAAAFLTLTFWHLASSREALRAGVLPFLMTMAVLVFWRMVSRNSSRSESLAVTSDQSPVSSRQSRNLLISQSLSFALLIAFTFHTYLAARVAWGVFPLFLIYLFLWHRAWFWRTWKPVLVGLIVAGVLVIPMFLYLRSNPYAQTRLEMLDSTFQAAREGNFVPLLRNVGRSLAAFVVPGFGDQFLAYNIPGRPVFDGLAGVFFLVGLMVCLWRWRQPTYALILFWFVVGIVPSLVTGPTANTTRNLAALTPLMMIPAVGLGSLWEWVGTRKNPVGLRKNRPFVNSQAVSLLLLLPLFITAFITCRDYFVRWGGNPDVRAAYQQNLVQGIEWINEHAAANQPIIVSTVYPGPAHDPSIARVFLDNKDQPIRWVDARLGMILPGGAAATLIVPSSTPLHPTFATFTESLTRIDLRPDDLDPFFTIYTMTPPEWENVAVPVNFNDAIQLVGYNWSHHPVQPGDIVELTTVWYVLDPAWVGSIVPPSFTTDMVFFTQVLRPDNTVFVQQDRLDVPSWGWQTGDIVVQIHQLALPGDAAAGEYQVIVGMYDRTSLQRTPVIDDTGTMIDDKAAVPPLTIQE